MIHVKILKAATKTSPRTLAAHPHSVEGNVMKQLLQVLKGSMSYCFCFSITCHATSVRLSVSEVAKKGPDSGRNNQVHSGIVW